MTDGGWTESAHAWIAQMGESGDAGRRYVLDPSLLSRVAKGRFKSALDVGCGEGRFCRLLKAQGISAIGIDRTEPLINKARERDPDGDYRLASAEELPFDDSGFDLVVSCLTLLDIPDYLSAIAEMARVLAPNGSLLVANLTPHMSAGMRAGWQCNVDETPAHFGMDDYSGEWCEWVEWAGIRVQNWHRPLSAYMKAFLEQGLLLTFFDEPKPSEGYFDEYDKYARAPWFNVMEWRKADSRFTACN